MLIAKFYDCYYEITTDTFTTIRICNFHRKQLESTRAEMGVSSLSRLDAQGENFRTSIFATWTENTAMQFG